MTKFEVSLVGGNHDTIKFEADAVQFKKVDLMAFSLVGDTAIFQVWSSGINHIAITDDGVRKTAWLVAKGEEVYESANGTPEIIWRQKEANNDTLQR